MNIKGKLVTLRAIEKEDLELMREMLNDPEMENLVVGWAFPVSKYEQEKWYENNVGNKNNLRFIVETNDNKEAVGLAVLTDIDWKNRRAVRGVKLANTSSRKKGIGTDVIMALMRYAFEELQLNRMDIRILSENEPSKKLFLKCGGVIEGVERKSVYKKGKYHDVIVGGMLKEDYEKLILENDYWNK